MGQGGPVTRTRLRPTGRAPSVRGMTHPLQVQPIGWNSGTAVPAVSAGQDLRYPIRRPVAATDFQHRPHHVSNLMIQKPGANDVDYDLPKVLVNRNMQDGTNIGFARRTGGGHG